MSGLHALDLIVLGCILLWIILALLYMGKRKKDKNVEVVPAPTTKICPYCFTEINIHATRCPHCTSVLEQKEEAKEEQTIE